MISRTSSSPRSIASSTSSRTSATSRTSRLTGWDGDDASSMSSNEYAPSRPLSVAIPGANGPHGPYCPRRPNLKEILANTSPAPWTLAAFMAYLSNNHCLETLEFTMDAGRYRKHYAKMMSRAPSGGLPPSKDREYVRALWQRLVDAYIRPSGSREVNLPSDVRDPILERVPGDLPPAPETLDRAVTKIYELMEESVLVPFLNSVYPQGAHPQSAYPASAGAPYAYGAAAGESTSRGQPHDRRSRYVRSVQTPQSAVDRPPSSSTGGASAAAAATPADTTRRRPLSNTTSSPNRARHSMRLSATTSSPTGPESVAGLPGAALVASASGSGSVQGMTDDSGSTDSHGDSPVTPPLSPPVSDASPKRDSGMWKKLGRLSGMKVGRRKSHGGLNEE